MKKKRDVFLQVRNCYLPILNRQLRSNNFKLDMKQFLEAFAYAVFASELSVKMLLRMCLLHQSTSEFFLILDVDDVSHWMQVKFFYF